MLLSPASGMWFSTYNLPLPGHILIYGPPVCSALQPCFFLLLLFWQYSICSEEQNRDIVFIIMWIGQAIWLSSFVA